MRWQIDSLNNIPTNKISRRTHPRLANFKSSIEDLIVKANNFEIKISLILLVCQDQFVGLPAKNPAKHIKTFEHHYLIFKYNGVSLNYNSCITSRWMLEIRWIRFLETRLLYWISQHTSSWRNTTHQARSLNYAIKSLASNNRVENHYMRLGIIIRPYSTIVYTIKFLNRCLFKCSIMDASHRFESIQMQQLEEH